MSADYLKEQKRLHFGTEKQNRKYGTGGPQFAVQLNMIAGEHSVTELLDYGCGKAVLRKHLATYIEWRGYDPAVDEYSALPQPCEFVVCLDVLEHIEPQYLDAVLDHIVSLTKRLLFVSISLKPAGRCLSDGRNAHLIIQDRDWWQAQIWKRGLTPVREFQTLKMEYVALFEV